MARINLVKPGEEPDEIKTIYSQIAESRAALANSLGVPKEELITDTWRAYANAPALMRAAWQYRHALEGGNLSKHLKEMIAIVAVNAQMCEL